VNTLCDGAGTCVPDDTTPPEADGTCGDKHPKKTELCHFPQGNTDNMHTICVGNPAWLNAHIAHGDTLGACQ
jgi:hypothetical protein